MEKDRNASKLKSDRDVGMHRLEALFPPTPAEVADALRGAAAKAAERPNIQWATIEQADPSRDMAALFHLWKRGA